MRKTPPYMTRLSLQIPTLVVLTINIQNILRYYEKKIWGGFHAIFWAMNIFLRTIF